MNRGIEQYEQSPPAYEAESTRPFLEADEQFVAGEDMYKETVANSTLEIRMRKDNLVSTKSSCFED